MSFSGVGDDRKRHGAARANSRALALSQTARHHFPRPDEGLNTDTRIKIPLPETTENEKAWKWALS